MIVVGTIPAVIAGGIGEDWIDDNLGEPWMIAILLIVFGLILWDSDRRPQDKPVEAVGCARVFTSGSRRQSRSPRASPDRE